MTKPGWRTTECWLALIATLFPVGMAIADMLPPEHAATVGGAVAALYGAYRTLLKALGK